MSTLIESANKLYPLIIKELSEQKEKKYNEEKWDFKELDTWKTKDLVGNVKSRWTKSKKTWLTKEELQLLMDWKLAKGKFRPTLPKLIKQNDDADVEQVTTEGFQIILEYVTKHTLKTLDKLEYVKVVKNSIKKVSSLRGVGPATASLILSLLEGITDLAPPFFSDEAFIFFVVEPNSMDLKIKYNIKEYSEQFLPVILDLSQSTNSSMNILERGAWALKAYDLGKIDILANIKLPFKLQYKNEVVDKKRKLDDDDDDDTNDDDDDNDDSNANEAISFKKIKL